MHRHRIIFFGSSKFVIPIIEVLAKNFSAKGGPASGWDLALVVTTEKNPTDPVPSYCIRSKVRYYIVTDFRDKRLINDLVNAKAPIGVLASFGAIIPNEVLDLFPHGIINIHPSLLPKYRGSTPVQTAILNGDKTTGVTIIKLDEEVDRGPILTQVEEPIFENDTSESLHERLFRLGSSSIVRTIELYLKGKIRLREQNHAKATFTKRLNRGDGYIDLQNPPKPEVLARMIRAYYPWPNVWTKVRIKNHESRIKFLPEKKIQVEGRRPMNYKDFINGYPNLSPVMLNLFQHLNS
ncbi:MAG: methionyl-tRNA formyltransferase [Patescibacteria group bacterium]